LALTIYDTAGSARAGAVRPSDLPRDRSSGPASLFVTPSPLGLRLVYVEPILATTREHARLGTVAVEHVLSPSPAASTINTIGGDYVLPGHLVPVSLRTPGAANAASPNSFVVASPQGVPLLQASIDMADLQQAREHLRRIVIAVAVGVVGVTMLLLVGPILDRRVAARSASRETALSLTAQLVCGAVLAAMLVGFERWLGATVDPAAVDLRHFTLHPWGGPRLAVLSGILLCHAAVMWAGALGCVTALTRWRLPRHL